MELDSRIIEGKKPLTCFDIEEAKKYVGKDCYFSSKFENFENLSKVPHATLHNVDDSHTPFQCYGKDGVLCYDCFILPCEWVKEPEKKYRPYTIKDFEKAFLNGEFEDFIIFRDKHEPDNIYTMRYNGNYTRGKYEYICLGAKNFSFESLFENYEVADYDGDWQPFGVEVSRDENQREVRY